MKLVIGGAYSGKTYFIKEQYHLLDLDFISGEDVTAENISQYKCVCNFHKYIEKKLDCCEKIMEIFENNKDIIIELREVGSGIVPIDAFQRKYREAVGRAGCVIAEKSEEVYRLVCGNAMRIK